MPTPLPFHPDQRRRGDEEQDVPLPWSVRIAGASVIAHRARRAGVLGEVLAAIRSRRK